MPTPILGIPEVAPTQTDKTTTMNDAMVAIESATQDQLSVSFSGGDVTLSPTQYTRYMTFVCTGLSADRSLIVPLTKRVFNVRNATTHIVSVRGLTGSTVTVGANSGAVVQCDGTNCYVFGAGGIGPSGPAGQTGGGIAIDYLWSTSTSNSNPGSGFVACDASLPDVTAALYVSTTDHNGKDWTAVLDMLDASTSAGKGEMRLVNKSTGLNWLVLEMTARITHSGYREYTVTTTAYSAAAPFSASDLLTLTFSRTGDRGDAATIPTIATNNVLGNISGSVAAPVAVAVSDLLDAALGSTQGDLAIRTASGWTVLAPSTANYVLTTQGSGANPAWHAPTTVTYGTTAGTAAQGNDSRITGAQQTTGKGVANGYAGLDGTGKVPVAQLPTAVAGALHYLGTWNASTNSPTLVSGTGSTGGYYVVSTAGSTTIDGVSVWGAGDWIVFDGTQWDKLDGQANPVASVAGRQGAVTLTHNDLTDWASATSAFLTSAPVTSVATRTGAVTLTHSDLTDWSSATSAFLTSAPVTTVAGRTGAVTLAVADVTGAAPLASPALTGTPSAPTPSTSDDSTTLPTTAWVRLFLTAAGYVTTGSAPVTSVATRTGAVTLTHSDLTDWASATSAFLTSAPVSSVAGRTGAVTLAVADVSGAAPLDSPTFTTKIVLPSWTTAPSTAVGTLGFNSISGRYEFGIGGSVVNHVRLGGDTMTGALVLAANSTVPTPTTGDSSTNIVNAAWVRAQGFGTGSGSGTVTSVAGGTGLNGGTITNTGTLSVAYGTTTGTAAQGNDSRITGAEQTANKGAANGYAGLASDGFVPWAQMKPEVQNLPLGFIIPGKPTASQVYNLVMVMAVTIPANFFGSAVYDGTQATANSVFTLNRISGGTTLTALGTMTITSASHTSVTFSTQAAATLAAGDVLQLVCPSSQDATLSEVGITVFAYRV